jgi:adenosine deaminase
VPAGRAGEAIPRPLADLPKAHLHLHFTGAMRHSTLVDLAREHRVHLPEALVADWPPRLSGTDERGWFRFQRLYDIARSVIRTEADVRRLILETAQDERDEGSGWLEIQVDPSGYAGRFGGLTPTVELMLDAAAAATAATGVGIGVIIAANRTRHPLDARTLARLAAAHAGRGVVGFGLSNDERRGAAAEFAPAFRIAARAGLLSDPHGGELSGPGSVRACLDDLHADRIGHGVAAAADTVLTERIAAAGITLEVCPASNVALGVAATPADVPLRTLLAAGIPVALGADDPLLFGQRLTAQYQLARQSHGLADDQLAELARMSVRGSVAPAGTRAELLAGIDEWLRPGPQLTSAGRVLGPARSRG